MNVFAVCQRLIGLLQLSEVRRDRNALHARDAHVRGADVQRQIRIATRIVGQPSEILERGIDDQLTGGDAARQAAHGDVDVEQLVRQLRT